MLNLSYTKEIRNDFISFEKMTPHQIRLSY